MNKETFCALPFTAIFLGPDTGIKPCCSSSVALGFLNQNSIQEILQNHRTQDLRQSILDGKWHEGCRQCQRQFEQGIRSERKDDLEGFLQQHGSNIDKNYFKLVRMDLRWSNTCNLSCTYCYEYFSSKWAEIKGIKVNSVVDENEQSLFLLVEQHKDSVENIMMLGGEPLLQKQNAYLIDLVSRKSFYILTNLAVPLANNKVAQKLLQESDLHIGVSFETVRDRYEYVRHGAQWELFDSNLDYIKSQRPDVTIDAHSLYSIYSAFNLVEFYEYIVDKNVFNQVFWNLLESSGENMHASVFKLSKPLKEMAILEIEKVSKLFPYAPGIADLLSIKNTLSENLDSEMLPKDLGFIEEANSVELKLKKNPEKSFKNLWSELYANLLQR
jgi:organic radical activating enzyme